MAARAPTIGEAPEKAMAELDVGVAEAAPVVPEAAPVVDLDAICQQVTCCLAIGDLRSDGASGRGGGGSGRDNGGRGQSHALKIHVRGYHIMTHIQLTAAAQRARAPAEAASRSSAEQVVARQL